MGLLEGKTALITGAARGIGKGIALKFASEGANIAFTDLVIDENGLETEKEIAAFGVKAKGYASNAAEFTATEELVKQVVADFGRIDILVNNAGITKDALMLRMTETQWDAVIAVNLKSAFNFIHAVTPIMLKQKAGSIINMASVVGVHGNAGQCNYAASKAGLIALAKSIGQAVGSRGIPELDVMVRTVVQVLQEWGAEPFIVPAMGSHGGATAEGQREVLMISVKPGFRTFLCVVQVK